MRHVSVTKLLLPTAGPPPERYRCGHELVGGSWSRGEACLALGQSAPPGLDRRAGSDVLGRGQADVCRSAGSAPDATRLARDREGARPSSRSRSDWNLRYWRTAAAWLPSAR